jgi:TolA-binding protein
MSRTCFAFHLARHGLILWWLLLVFIATAWAEGTSPAPATPVAVADAATAPVTDDKGPKPSSAPTEPPAPASDGANGLINLGNNLTDRPDYAAAEIAFRQVIDSTDFPPEAQNRALLGLARCYRKQGVHTKAAAIYEKYLKLNPDDGRTPDVLLELGRTLRAMGAPTLALARFYSVINSTMKMPSEGFDHYQLLARTAQFEIAETHFETGNFAEAGKFFSRLRLLDLAPADRARAHFMSAYALQLAGELEKAVTTARAYLDQWPQDENVPEARHLLATMLRQLNRRDEALAATLELLQAERGQSGADPRRWAHWQRRTGSQLANEFFQSGDTTGALTIYQGLATLSPDPAWRLPVTYQIALCYERLQQPERAKAAYDEISALGANQSTPELADLAKMAEWRLAHMDWFGATAKEISALLATTQPAPAAKSSSPPAPHGNTETAPTNLR